MPGCRVPIAGESYLVVDPVAFVDPKGSVVVAHRVSDRDRTEHDRADCPALKMTTAVSWWTLVTCLSLQV